jgi:uncharacterized cupredoxin-like copper-binding protein
MLPARAIAAASLAAAALMYGGCGEQRAPGGRATATSPTPVGTPPPTAGKAVATVNVSLSDYRLDPVNPRVARPGVIAFVATNDGQTTHALAVDGPAGEVSSQKLTPGDQRTILMRLPPGTYKWLCPLADHEQRGMVGRVKVAE